MTPPHPTYRGLWLPLVTPFKDGGLDEASLRRLVRRFAPDVDGFVLCATTGEGLALSADETRRVLETVAEEAPSVPTLVGIGGSITSQVVAALQALEALPGTGWLISCPSYVRPSQDGLRLHFEALAAATGRDLLVYNIPYRTGVNLSNDTLLRLAEQPNVVGVKDCCADPAQTRDLCARKPAGFSVLAGDDGALLPSLRDGADGGITASAHLDASAFRKMITVAHGPEADAIWAELAPRVTLLFAEPNPSPLKHCLQRMGLIESDELRLPMTPVSAALAARLDAGLKSRR